MSEAKMDLSKIRGPKDLIAVITATALGAGFVPKAPGTAGAAIAVPLAFATAEWPIAWRLALWIGLTVAGTWAAREIDEIMGTSDNQSIVMDEVVGLGITAWTAGPNWINLLIAFILFRFFDIVKITPVRTLDRWSKKKASEASVAAKWWGGFGVMGDDVLAGFQGLIVMLVLQYFDVLSRF